MNSIQAVVLGLVEGVTEFLPVSSTFHLIFTAKALGMAQSDFAKLFEVVIQAGAILSVIFLFGKKMITNRHLLLNIFISFLPTAVVGLVLHKVIKNVFFESSFLMIVSFVAIGFVFLFVEYLIKKKSLSLSKHLKDMTIKEAFIIGLIQSFAVVPGVSRAGAVLVGMMFFSYKREEAALYSFFLAVPTVFAAAFFDLIKMRTVLTESAGNIGLLTIGSIVAFTASLIVIKWFIGFLKTNSLLPFALYRFLLAIILVTFRLF